jgi:RNA polymerase sigma-70 factor, ECF subfamily
MAERFAPGSDLDSAAWPALMARAQAGDQQAYACVLKAMVPAIRAIVRRTLHDDGQVEDVVQDVLLAVHRVRHTYAPERPILPWLSAIASARAIDTLRRRGRHQRWEVQDDDAQHAHADGAATQPMDLLDARSELEPLLRGLPLRQRQLVELVHLREMTLADAAAESRLSVAAVKSLLHRAFNHLRRHGERGHD